MTQPIVSPSASDPFWNAPAGLMEMSADYSQLRVNRRWLELAGRDESVDPLVVWRETIHPDDRERVAAEFLAALKEGCDFRSEYRFLRPDGTVVWIAGMASALRDDDGHVVGYSGCIFDITARVDLSERLDDQQLFDEWLFENSPLAIQVFNTDGSFRRMNAVMRKQSGVPNHLATNVLTSPLTAHTPLAEAFRTALNGEVGETGPWTVLHPFVSTDASAPREPRTMEHTACPVRNSAGEVTAVIIYGRDLSRRAAAKEALDRSEARFRAVFEQVSDGIAIFNGRTLAFVNQALCEIFRCTPEMAASAQFDRLFVDPQRRLEVQDEVESGAQSYHVFQAMRADGTFFDAAVRFSRLVSADWDDGWIVVVRDVTRREEARRELATSEAALRSYFDSDPSAVYVFDIDDSGTPLLTFANSSTLARVGTTLEKSVGRRAAEVFGAIWSEQLERRLVEVGRSGVGQQFESTFDPGSGPMTFVTRLNPILDAPAERVRVIGSTHDITEIRRAQEIAQEHRRLQSLAVLAAGVAHDFNNLLQSMLIGVDLASSMAQDGWEGLEMLQEVRTAATRAAELSQRMLAFSGGKPVRRSGVGLAEICAGVLAGAPHEGIELTLDVDPHKRNVATYGDEAQLAQVVDAVVSNAVEACEPGTGKVVVSVGTLRANDQLLARSHVREGLPGGEYALIRVADNGSGMSEELQRQMFEPFFSTRFVGRGLGLAATLGTVRGHGGTILVESAPGAGTTVSVLLPLHEVAAQTTGKAA